MPPVAINIGALLLLILPGFLSYRFAAWRRVDAVQRSPLWQLAEIIEHSVFVHLIGAGLIAATQLVLAWGFGLDTYASTLLQNGPSTFLKTHFSEAVLWFTLYPAFIVVASAVIGAYDIPGKVSSLIGRLAQRPAEPQEPVWYYAFNIMTDGYTTKIPHVLVRLKSGDTYFGELVSSPIIPDTDHGRDFLIRGARYYRNGDEFNEQRLFEADGIGAVLLNTANVDSIIIYYEDISNHAPA